LSAKWQIREADQVLRQFKKLGDQQKKQYREAVKTLLIQVILEGLALSSAAGNMQHIITSLAGRSGLFIR
jgi:mRNA-degrading endonuclease RelE of RelBE toxin-antitoxin system